MGNTRDYGKFGGIVVFVSSYWTVVGAAIAALLIGISKFWEYGDKPYAALFLVAACILFLTACFDTPASFLRLEDEGWPKWLKILNAVGECVLAVLAIFALIYAARAVGFSDEEKTKKALEVGYALALAKYSSKIILKGFKAGVKSSKFDVVL